MSENYAVFVGLDVGKSAHHACALAEDGSRLYDKPLVQDEVALKAVFESLQQHGPVLMIVDQPNTIGALPVAVARDCGCQVAYLPGLAMRKAADLYPGRSKTDARDAFIIADTARTMPHTLRAVDRDSEVLSALKMLAGFDDDIARDCTRTKNRLRSVLTQIHPALERVFIGDILARAVVLDLLMHYGGPHQARSSRPRPGTQVGPQSVQERPRRARRSHLRRPSRTDCHRARHRGCRAGHPAARCEHQIASTTAGDNRQSGRGDAR